MRSTDPYVNAIQNMAGHVTDVMTRPAPCKFTVSIGGGVYRVTIEKGDLQDKAHPAYKLDDGKQVNIWDQVYIALDTDAKDDKGNWCGNRCGGRDTLAGLYADDIKKMLTDQVAA